MQVGIDLYVQLIEGALPIGLAFIIGDLIVSSFLKMAFKGKVEF